MKTLLNAVHIISENGHLHRLDVPGYFPVVIRTRLSHTYGPNREPVNHVTGDLMRKFWSETGADVALDVTVKAQ